MAVSGSHVQKSQTQHWLFSKLKRATGLAAFLLLVCLLPTPATAQGLALSASERAYLAENAPIVFVSQSNYPPFEFMDDEGQSDGMMVELAQWVADEAGFEARFTHTDFSTAQAQIQAGRADVLTSFFYSPTRDTSFEFTQTIFEVPAAIFVPVDRPDITRLEDLDGLRVATQRGDYAEEFLEEAGIDVTLVSTINFANAVLAVLEGKADAMIGDEQIVLFQLYRSGLNMEMKRVSEPLYTGLNSMAVKEGEHLLQSILNKSIAHAREQGVIERINAKWLGKILPLVPIKWGEYWPHALIIIIGALWVVAWNLRLRQLVRRKTDELRLAASVFRNAHDAIMLTDEQGNTLDVNAAFTRITGYEAIEVLNQPSALLDRLFDIQHDESLQATLANDGVWQGEIWEKHKNGERYPIQLTLSLVKDTAIRSTHFVIVFTDISRQKEYESRLQHLAYFDRLTDLPNREGFTQRLTQIMQEARESQHSVILAYLDLDGFKEINDRYDHSLGDQVLRVVAERLRSTLKNNEIVARLGGDEFVMVLPHQPCDLEMQRVIQQLIQRVNQPIRFNHCELQVSASVGVAAYDGNEDIEPDQFIRQADHAMYQAKQLGKNRYHLFDQAHERAVRGHHQSIARMQQALADDEFVLFYQPKINMRSGNIIGVEALIRWQHPEQGLLPPAMFLPDIQQHPFAIALGEWVVNSALQQCSDWKVSGIHWPVSVNIDGIHLQHPHFTQWLSDTLDTFPDYTLGDLEIEALESSALDDMQGVADIMRQCQTLGVDFALDDFGTGYSTLAYLRYLPAGILKIDRSFVLNMLDNEEDLVMLKGVLSLAEAFQRRVIAEGVETSAHARALLAMGCEYGQGYAFARPMPASQLLEWKTQFTLPTAPS